VRERNVIVARAADSVRRKVALTAVIGVTIGCRMTMGGS